MATYAFNSQASQRPGSYERFRCLAGGVRHDRKRAILVPF